jgi:hypothetical protein
MKKFLAAWRAFQELVVRHPGCRYTILPACIILAIWLVALAMMAGVWFREGWDVYEFATDGIAGWNEAGFGWSVMVIIGMVTVLLTGRWIPTLVGLFSTIFALGTYLQTKELFLGEANIISGIYENHFLWKRLAIFVPALLWLLFLDWKSARLPRLPGRTKWLAGAAAVFCLALVLVWGKVESHWIKAGLLQSISAAFWFAILFDLAWRISHDRFGRILRGLLAGGMLGLYVWIFLECHGWSFLVVETFALLAGLALNDLFPDRDTEIN